MRSGSRQARVAYRAVDEALVVICPEGEFRVELPGWSMEEVHAIVECIERGEWSLFHEVMSWGGHGGISSPGPISEGNELLPPGSVAIGALEPFVGNDVSVELGAQEERNQEETGEIPMSVWTPSIWSLSIVQLGQGWWMFVSGVFVWGLYCCLLSLVSGFGGEGALARVTPMSTLDDANEALGLLSLELTGGGAWLVTAWVFLSLHRVGALIAGSLRDPPGLVVEVPGIEGFVYFPVPQRVELWIWIVVLVILGMGHPASAASILDSETSLVVFQGGRREEGQQEGFCARQ